MARMFVPFTILFVMAFVAGGVLLALGKDMLAVPIFGTLVLIAVVDMIGVTFRIGRGNRRLARRSDVREGRATVLEAYELPLTLHMGGTVYQPRAFKLRLRVELPNADPYEVTHLVGARPWDVDHIRPGNVIACRVHPRRRKKLVLVFPEGTTEYGVTDLGAARSFGPGDGPLGGSGPAGPGDGPLGGSGPAGSVDGITEHAIADRIIRETTGMSLRDVVDRTMAGEQVPGVVVHHDVRSTSPTEHFASSSWSGDPAEASAGAEFSRVAATAVVEGLHDLGPASSGSRLVALDLLVSVVGRSPYRVAVESEFSPGSIPGLGQTVHVDVDLRRPSRVRFR